MHAEKRQAAALTGGMAYKRGLAPSHGHDRRDRLGQRHALPAVRASSAEVTRPRRVVKGAHTVLAVFCTSAFNFFALEKFLATTPPLGFRPRS